jgi:hypothetical protein
MAPQGTVHKKTEDSWTVELDNGMELPIPQSDVITFYKEIKTCGSSNCNCWVLKEGLRVEYQIIEIEGIQYANII